MQIAPRMVTKNAEVSDVLRQRIDDRIEKLQGFFGGIIGVRMFIEGPSAHHRTARQTVRIEVHVPARPPILITRQGDVDLDVAVREAFDAADRRVEDYIRKLRGDVKSKRA